MENLSSILDAESPSLPREVIEEVKTVRRASQSKVEQMQDCSPASNPGRGYYITVVWWYN